MIGVDTNILVQAHRQDSPSHDIAKRCVTELAEGSAAWAIPWPCVHEFLAIVTHPRIFAPPTRLPVAIRCVAAWLASPSLVVLAEAPEHWSRLAALLEAGGVAGATVHDARVAAICLEHGVREFWSADRDFRRFPQLKVVNPLVEQA